MKSTETTNYKFQSKRSIINDVESILSKLNESAGIPEERFINFQIAVSEALINCIVHGNKEDAKKFIHVKIQNLENFIKIFVKDEGDGFKPENIPDPTDMDNLYKEHGRGIFIIKSLVDDFQVNSGQGGTEFVLTMNK